MGTFSEPGPEEKRIVLYLIQVKWLILSVIYVWVEPFIGILTFTWGQLGLFTMIYLKQLDETSQIFDGKFYNYVLPIHIFGWLT